MIDAMYIGATGMAAQQTFLETTANNLANMNTPAFKRSHAVFEDLMYRETTRNNPYLKSTSLGLGSQVATINKIFSQGDLKATESQMDVAINGAGLVEVVQGEGQVVFSRLGALKVNEDGQLALRNGMPINPPIYVPEYAQGVEISPQGKVIAKFEQGEAVEIGQIELALFPYNEGLKPLGENLYAATDISGEAVFHSAGLDGRGTFAQQMVETSNVRMADELVNVMMAQRAFEANARIIQAADEMLSLSNNLRRG